MNTIESVSINTHKSEIIPIVNAKVSRGRKKTENVTDGKKSLKTKLTRKL